MNPVLNPDAPHAAELLDRALAVVDGWFDDDAGLLWNPPRSFEPELEPLTMHMVPQSALYAVGLLMRRSDGDLDRAHQVIDAVIATQYDEPGATWHGTYARFAEWPRPSGDAIEWLDYDPNWREFVGTAFALVLHRLADGLPDSLVARMTASIVLAQRSEPEGRIGAHYANIALMKAWLDADTGRRVGDQSLVVAGERFAREVVERFSRHGAFDEYGSATYYGVDLFALALWRELPPTDRFRVWADQLESTLWHDVARWYHAGLGNLCGPYTRAYGMDMHAYAGLLGLWMWPELGEDAHFPPIESPFEHRHDLSMAPLAALLGPSVPDDVTPHLRRLSGERTVEQVITTSPRRVATGWLAPLVMAGGEDAEDGYSARGQYHPATVHWRRPDGGVGTIRVEHVGPVRATAAPGRLELRIADHRRAGPTPTTFVVDIGGPVPDLSDPRRWALPGLDVVVDGPADGVTMSAAGPVWPPGPVELVLHLRPDPHSGASTPA